ncbi:MAG: hypothetical protein WAO08_39190, partial [Hyphomicrobiaceae bacterium]
LQHHHLAVGGLKGPLLQMLRVREPLFPDLIVGLERLTEGDGVGALLRPLADQVSTIARCAPNLERPVARLVDRHRREGTKATVAAFAVDGHAQDPAACPWRPILSGAAI